MIYKRGKQWHLDVTVNSVRYREALDTTDKREALNLEKKRVGEILAGKGASKAGRQFARLPFGAAADLFIEERRPHISERTSQLDRERLKPLRLHFGETPLLRITASEVSAYQRARLSGRIRLKANAPSLSAVGNRTVNMEVTVLRQMMRRAKVWLVISEDVKMLPEQHAVVGRVLTREQKELLFRVAGSRDAWMVAHCAAVLAVSTTCRKVELRHLRWQNVDLFDRSINIQRSKRESGRRVIPLNSDALAALARLLERARVNAANEQDHFVFPTCEHERIDATRPQKTWRSAWRSLTKATGKAAGTAAAKLAVEQGEDPEEAHKRAAAPFQGFRFHDLRHQAITELAESGASDATIMAVAGHLSRQMMEHYSHVRMAAKRTALDKLESGLMGSPKTAEVQPTDAVH